MDFSIFIGEKNLHILLSLHDQICFVIHITKGCHFFVCRDQSVSMCCKNGVFKGKPVFLIFAP